MAKLTNAEIIDAIKELTVMELNELVNCYGTQRPGKGL